MASVLVPIAEGCEELEAVTIIDLLRRAGIEVIVAGLDGGKVRASRGTVLLPDTSLDQAMQRNFDMIVLPGGLPGADNLNQDQRIHDLLHKIASNNGYTAAICAAPKILATAGLLDGKQATGYPGIFCFEIRSNIALFHPDFEYFRIFLTGKKSSRRKCLDRRQGMMINMWICDFAEDFP